MQPNFNPAEIKLIIGLGNPGKEYENTYHNVGFLFVDYITENLPISKPLKSNMYMNESGSFVKGMLKKKGVKAEELFLIHDDSDLDLGKYKIDFDRGSAGHKGVESVMKTLDGKNFWRLRIGIRRKTGLFRRKAGNFVLKKISRKNRAILKETFAEITPLLLS